MKAESPLVISVGSQAPITVAGSPVLCPGLNAQYLGGNQASAFALASHVHVASDVQNGTFVGERLGSGSLVGLKALFSGGSGGSQSVWRSIQTSDLVGVTDFTVDYLLPAMDPAQARAALEAAAAVHTHATADVTSGVFDVARVGSGSSTSAAKLLFGSNVVGGSPQWRTPVVADIQGAVGFAGSPTTGRIPYWSAPGTLSNSPFACVGSPVSSVTTDADFGTNGTVTCTDLVLNYAAATQFKANVYAKTKAILQGSASVTVTPNDGAQTLTLESTGSGGVTPPTTPANAVKVWVVNAAGDDGDWYTLTGDNVYAGA